MAKGHKDSVKYEIGYSQAEKAPRSSYICPAKKIVDLRPPKKLNICMWIMDLGLQNGRCLSEIVDLRANCGQTLPNQAQKNQYCQYHSKCF